MANIKSELDDYANFGNLELLAQQVVEGFITGLHKSPFHGFSVEFAEHRLYNTGNSIKNIDWKLFARTEKLFVKRFEEETNLRCHLIIDCSSSMYYPKDGFNKFQFAALSSASIINLLKKQRDAFGLTLFAEEVEIHTPAKSTGSHQKYIINELSKRWQHQDFNQGTHLVESLHLIAEQIHKRSLLVLFTDMFESGNNENYLNEVFMALQHLKYAKNEIIIFNINEKRHELEFDFENKPYHFIDIESREEIKLNPSQLRDVYHQKILDYKENIALKCAQYKIDLVDANLEEGVYPILNAWLLKRNRML